MKFDPSVKREIGYVTLGTLLLTAAEIGVFFAIGYYNADVLYGALLSAAAGILNFFLLAVTVTRVLSYPPEEEAAAKGLMKLSRTARMLFLFAILAVGCIFFNKFSTVITIIFPRVVIGVRSIAVKREAPAIPVESEETDEPAVTVDEETATKGSEEDGTDEN